MSDIRSYGIEELELGVRAYNILKRMGVDSIGQFMGVSVQDLNAYTLATGIAVGLRAARQIADAQEYVKTCPGW